MIKMYLTTLLKPILGWCMMFTIFVSLQAQRTEFYRAIFAGTGATSGNSWTATGRNACVGDGGDFFGTQGGRFVLNNFDGDAGVGCPNGISIGEFSAANNSTWTATVDISQYANVGFLIAISTDGVLENNGTGRDGLRISYTVSGGVGGGGQTFNLTGNGFSTIYGNDEPICGNTLTITVTFGTQAADESIFIDAVAVDGERATKPSAAPRSVERCVGQVAVLNIANVPAGAQIAWADGNGNAVGTNAPTYTTPVLNTAGAFFYTALVSDPSGCETELEFEVTVSSRIGNVTLSDVEACVGETARLTARVASSGNYVYEWTGPNGRINNNSPTLVIPNLSLANAGLYEVVVIDPNLGDCGIDDAQANVSVIPGPGNVRLTPDQIICTGGTTRLVASPSNQGNWTYQWFKDGRVLSATQQAISVNEAGLYEVIVSDPTGQCIADAVSSSVTLQNSFGRISVEETPVFCAGNDVSLIISTENPGSYQFSWLLPNGSIQNITGTNGTLNLRNIQAGNAGLYRLVVTDPVTGCSNLDNPIEVEVSLSNPPIPPIVSQTNVCEGFPTLQATNTPGSFIFWYASPNAPADQFVAQGFNFAPTVAGTYYAVAVNFADGIQCASRESAALVEQAIPVVAQITTVKNQLCENETTTLTATGGTSYRWSNGATTSQITVPAGNYRVTVTNDKGCTGNIQTTVQQLPPAIATITGTPNFCAGQSTTLTASGGTSYRWSNGAVTPSINVNQAGNFTVTVTNANGCTDSKVVAVQQFAEAVAEITGAPNFCAGQSTTLTATGGTSYRWSNGAVTPSINVNQAGNFTVTVTNANGCTDSEQVVVQQFAEAVATITGTPNFCAGGQTTLTATGGTSYIWSNGAVTPSINVNQAGNFTVTVTNANGCTDSEQIAVQQFAEVVAIITGTPNFCAGQSTTLTATGGTSYRWNNGAVTPSINVNQAGNFTVTVTNANGCTDSEQVAVQQFPAVVASITGSNVICEGAQTTLIATGGTTFRWSNGETTSAVTVSAGTYSVEITNENGCSTSASTIVTESELPTFTFTSNATCNAQLDGYAVAIATANGNTVTASEGTIIVDGSGAFRIVNVPSGKNVVITVRNVAGCTTSAVVNAPDCSCPTVAAPVSNGNIQICEGDELPSLVASISGENLVIDWYDAPSGGNLLAAGRNNFVPTAPGTYYAEARNSISSCQSSVRTAITLTAFVRPKATIQRIENITCRNDVGTITIAGSNGQPPYRFSIDGVNTQDSPIFTDLPKGLYTITVIDQNGCESQTEAVIQTLTRSDFQENVSFTCVASEIGRDTMFLINEFGCDSIIVNIARDGRTASSRFTRTTCEPSQVGLDTLILQNNFGCDSLIITNFVLAVSDTTFINRTSCDPNSAGTRINTFTNTAGCDSVVVITTVFADKDVFTIVETTCNPSEVGVDTLRFINRLGCDSLIITETMLRGFPDTTFLERITCDVNTVGMDTLFLSNQAGCDSLVIINSIFDFPAAPRITVSTEQPICPGDTVIFRATNYTVGLQWLRNGQVILGANSTVYAATEAGIYAVTFTNDDGCSVVSVSRQVSLLPVPPVPFFSNTRNLLSLQKPEAFVEFTLQWYLNDTLIAGATLPDYCAKSSGTYTLVVTNPVTGCSTIYKENVEFDATIENCLVAIQELDAAWKPLVYPNPHSNNFVFTMEVPYPSHATIELVDILGRTLVQSSEWLSVGKFETSINTSHLINGVYVLKVQTDGKTWATKLVKQHEK